MGSYYVYILQCTDGSYYTGVTNDLERRLMEHETGADPKAYTYNRRPVQLLWYDSFQTPTAAIEVEKQLKGWSRRKKEALIAGHFHQLPELAKAKQRRDSHH